MSVCDSSACTKASQAAFPGAQPLPVLNTRALPCSAGMEFTWVLFAFGDERDQCVLPAGLLCDPERAAIVLERSFLSRSDKLQTLPLWPMAFCGEKGELSLAFLVSWFQTNSFCWFPYRKGMSAANCALSEPLFREERFARAAWSAFPPILCAACSEPGGRDEPWQFHGLPPRPLWLSHLQFLWDGRTRPGLVWI